MLDEFLNDRGPYLKLSSNFIIFCAFTLYKTNLHELNFVIIKICFEMYNNKLYFLDTMKLIFNYSIPCRIIFKSYNI